MESIQLREKIGKNVRIISFVFSFHLVECYCRYRDSIEGESKMAACSHDLRCSFSITSCSETMYFPSTKNFKKSEFWEACAAAVAENSGRALRPGKC